MSRVINKTIKKTATPRTGRLIDATSSKGGAAALSGGGAFSHSHVNKALIDLINQGLSTESSVQFKDVVASGAITAGATNETPADDLPAATDGVFGVVKIDGITIKIDPVTGKIYAEVSSGGVSSWDELTDIPQNLIAIAALTGAGLIKRNTDGTFNLDTTVYQTYDSDLATIAAIADGIGFLRRTGQNTWIIDTNTYLTSITKAMVEAVLTGNIATHTHSQYLTAITKAMVEAVLTGSITTHTHSQYLTAITKAMVEAVLTGIITSHQHNYMPISGGNFTNPITILSQTVWYAGNSGSKLYDWLAKDIKAVNGYFDGACTAGAANDTPPDDLPVAAPSLYGVIRTGLSLHNNAGITNINGRHYTTTSVYTDTAVREITAEIVLGTGSMANGTLDQIQLSFAPLTTTRGLTANVIATNTGAGMSLKLSFRKDTGTGRWYIMVYNDSGAAITRDGILLSIRGQQTI
nr:hypothetical protein [uncultured Macellibacteroides sp.]